MKSYAGFWQRVKAFAFDYLIITFYLVCITGLFAFVNSATEIVQNLFADRIRAQAFAFLIVTLPVTLYFVVGESSVRQATWGKRRVGLSVEDRNGKRIGFWRAFSRTLLKFIPWELSHTLLWNINFSQGTSSTFINYGFVLVYLLIGLYIASVVMTRTKQALYDLIAGTYVVR